MFLGVFRVAEHVGSLHFYVSIVVCCIFGRFITKNMIFSSGENSEIHEFSVKNDHKYVGNGLYCLGMTSYWVGIVSNTNRTLNTPRNTIVESFYS